VLRVGLTGGIGSGKSTVARRLVRCGALLVDSDVLAREAVAPGTDGLAEIAATFGAGVLAADGALDRPALARLVFGDPAARERLNAIVHPRVRRRSEEIIAAAPPDAVLVQDIPLLVEGAMAPQFPLVIVVHAPAGCRVDRLVRHRGMTEADAMARVAAQADDAARRAAADVWLDNGGPAGALDARIDTLWRDRLLPFEENLRLRRAVAGPSTPVAPDPGWPADGARLATRVAGVTGGRYRVAHVGPTAVPGRPAPDVIDLLVGLTGEQDDADGARRALAEAGFPGGRDPRGPHGSADPGRPARVHLHRVGSEQWRALLLVRDWLLDTDAPVQWATGLPFPTSLFDAETWAVAAGWSPSPG
jgi:dephospho-CoA kinase